MKIAAAHRVPFKQVEEFLKTAQHVKQDRLLQEGYVVLIDNKIRGCFILTTVERGIYWLKQLYISQEAAGKLPILLETILQMSKQLQAKKVYVHSHQPVVDILLDALQFHLQEASVPMDNQPVSEGNWWAYNVS